MDITTRDLKLLAIGAVASVGLTTILTSQFYGNPQQSCRVIDSPLSSIRNNLTEQHQSRLPYPPDALEGARDVSTPFGSIRVYEWGPEDGRRVLLVHGISTPCVALAELAGELARGGCRVMLFDLFGRGFSSTPDPTQHPQTIQLFTIQIHLVLSSSPISWTGSTRFTLIGYSLGGGISASFTSHFPNLIDSLILIAPSGLLRPSRIHWTSKLLYGNFLPQRLVEWLVWRRLGGTSTPKVTPTQALESETSSHPALTPDSSAPVSSRRPSVSISDVVFWQLNSHKGFIPAFISSIQHAPISNQHSTWKAIADRQKNPNEHHLREKKVLLLLGQKDNVVFPDETAEDAKAVLGDAVDIRILDGGHDLPVTDPKSVAKAIRDFWAAAPSSGEVE